MHILRKNLQAFLILAATGILFASCINVRPHKTWRYHDHGNRHRAEFRPTR